MNIFQDFPLQILMDANSIQLVFYKILMTNTFRVTLITYCKQNLIHSHHEKNVSPSISLIYLNFQYLQGSRNILCKITFDAGYDQPQKSIVFHLSAPRPPHCQKLFSTPGYLIKYHKCSNYLHDWAPSPIRSVLSQKYHKCSNAVHHRTPSLPALIYGL